VVGGGVGDITESDANLALASNAVLFGFTVAKKPMPARASSSRKVWICVTTT
jgi:translation initiation factor IF-2